MNISEFEGPVDSGCAELIGSMKGTISVKGDILSTGVRWDAANRLSDLKGARRFSNLRTGSLAISERVPDSELSKVLPGVHVLAPQNSRS